MTSSDQDRRQTSPAEQKDRTEDQEPLFLGSDDALQQEQGYRHPEQTGRHEIPRPLPKDSDEEAYWFSTFLESSVRDQTIYEHTTDTVPPALDHPTLPLVWGLSPDEDFLASQLRAPSIYGQARHALETSFADLRANELVEHNALEGLASQIVSNIVVFSPNTYDLRSPLFADMLYSYLFSSFGKPYDFVDHSINVAILSVIFAKERGASNDELVRLCLAALLHDVGMLLIPSKVWDHPRPLSEKEWATVMYHSELGQKLVSKLGGALSGVAAIVGQEHERADGRGYPLGLKGSEIDEFAKIIGMVDVFDALTHERLHRPSCTPHQAIRKILTEMREAFDRNLFKAFLSLITVFPLGSYVELSTGEVGRVVQVNGSYPLRPMVEVVLDADGFPVPSPMVLELWNNPLISISRCLDSLNLPPGGKVASDPSEVLE